jgi:hypothetical protein
MGLWDVRKAPSIPNNVCFPYVQTEKLLRAVQRSLPVDAPLINYNLLKASIHTRHYQ